MAILLNIRFSTLKFIDAVRRHLRLCKQSPGTQKYIDAIEGVYLKFIEICALLQEAANAVTDAYDDIIQADEVLDNAVRTVFEKCKQFDRDHKSIGVLQKIFPEKKFGPIIKEKRSKEIALVEQMIVKFESLGPKHPLFPMAAYLRKQLAIIKRANKAYGEAIHKETLAKAQVDIAKGNLMARYEENYLEARKDLGKNNAEKLFPKLISKKTREESVEILEDSVVDKDSVGEK